MTIGTLGKEHAMPSWFYEYIYPICALISFVSIIGAPFVCILFVSLIGMSEEWWIIKRGWYVKLYPWDYKATPSEVVGSCFAFLGKGIPVWCLIITFVFAYGFSEHGEETKPVVYGTYAKVIGTERQFCVGQGNVVSDLRVDLGYGIIRTVTAVNHRANVGDVILIGSLDGRYYFTAFGGKKIVPQPIAWL